MYAACAMVLYPLRRLAARALLGAVVAVWLAAFVVESGSEAEYVVRVLAMMLVGMGLYRTGVIVASRGADWYRRTLLRSFAVGLPVCTVAWLFADRDEGLAADVNNMGVPFMAVRYVCLVMWVCLTGRMPRLQDRLEAAGQMALTNYLMQTVLGTVMVGWLNEVRDERVTAVWMMGVMLAIGMMRLGWSVPWMRAFRFGPAEWLWRSTTYRRAQLLRLSPLSQG